MEPNNNKDESFVPTDVPTYHKWSCFQVWEYLQNFMLLYACSKEKKGCDVATENGSYFLE